MDREAIRLLPGDAELARRASGGDGAAFVHVYDRRADEVFELALAVTDTRADAAHATKEAFLALLRRPPALAAPDDEVGDRLLGLLLHVCGADDWPEDRRPAVHAGRFHAVDERLRRETVTSAAARFDDDWSPHLARRPPRHASPPAEARAPDHGTPRAIPASAAIAAARRPGHGRTHRARAVAALLLILALLAGALGTMLSTDDRDAGSASADPASAWVAATAD